MTWITLPTWAEQCTPPISRQRAAILYDRIPASLKKYGPKGRMVKVGAPKPSDLKPGRPKKK